MLDRHTPIQFDEDSVLDETSLYGEVVICSHCNRLTGCDRGNVRTRWENDDTSGQGTM